MCRHAGALVRVRGNMHHDACAGRRVAGRSDLRGHESMALAKAWRSRKHGAHESMGGTGMSNVVRGLVTGAILSAAAVGLGLGLTSAACAEGAIAIGASGDFAKDGFAFGASINKSSADEAGAQ